MKHTLCILMLLLCIGINAPAATPIQGTSLLTEEQMTEYILRNNPEFDPEIAAYYYFVGDIYGIRADLALCQAIFETGWFKYPGSMVKPEQHNYCGLGVTGNGVTGNGFATVDDGVTAHLQHLYAYCTVAPLPEDEELADPRFGYVTRGSAPTWEEIGRYWACNPSYHTYLFNIYDRILRYYQDKRK